MIVSLDLGATEFRSLRQQPNCLVGRRNLAVYTALPDRDAEQSLLSQMCIPWIRCEDSLIVLGTAAIDLCRSMRTPCIPLLVNGRIPSEDPLGRQLISTLIDTLLPDAGSPTPCGLVSRQGVDQECIDDLRFYAQVLRLKGYQPYPVTTTEALSLAELGQHAFSGMVLDWGGDGASLAYYRTGQPLAETLMLSGGRQIDQRMATIRDRYRWGSEGERYLDFLAVEAWKQSMGVRIDRPRNDDEKLLANLIRDQLKSLCYRFAQALVSQAVAAPVEAPQVLVCGGCGTRIAGFVEILSEVLDEVHLPIPVAEIQVGPLDPFRTARGALIGVQLESASVSIPQVA